MAHPFYAQIKKALDNPGLQAALDNNAERRISASQVAFASLPEELNVLRQRAHAVRAETIAHLDRYLEQFVRQAEANGMIVHRAGTAAEAVEIVREIARQNGVKVVSKSKTMVGEEIEINSALEADGLKVVETDLGEYIVQLRRERPAHIVTPAVHLRRGDVAKTFHEKLGMPLTEDVVEMTATARRVLRQTFLESDMGISGVNFGVAEEGILCMITNEGNGRMVTTLPPVHVALMGIERLVPTMKDLALMLSLLPRASTGQKLTVYTSLIRGPRRPGDLDGPRERHVVLVDNGRMELSRSPLAESLFCIRCGACLNACPVFRELGGHAYVNLHGEGTPYPGPIGSVVSPGLFGQPEWGHLARASSLCGACKEACPVDIDLPKLLLRVRAGGMQVQNPAPPRHVPSGLNLALKTFSWAAASPWRFQAAQRMASLLSRLLAPFSGWLRAPASTGWGLSRDFPRPAVRPFRDRWTARHASGTAAGAGKSSPSVISLQPSKFFSTESPLEEAGWQTASRQTADRQAAERQTASRQALLDRFAAEITALGGSFRCVPSGQAGEAILSLLIERGINRIQAWEAGYLPQGILGTLRTAGIEIQQSPDPGIKAGLTGALAGIAETGSLVLPGGPGTPHTASLLTEVHLAVLYPEDIYQSLEEVLDSQAVDKLSALHTAPSTVLVTGPSRTADIEMTLTIGVHGPGEVHVFCIK